MKKILILLFIFISPTIFANSISDCKIISDDTERLQCYDSLSVEITQQEENSKNESVSNLKEEGIFHFFVGLQIMCFLRNHFSNHQNSAEDILAFFSEKGE